MDHRSFDRLARLLGGASDRRTGLKALAGGLLGAGGLAALDAESDAKRKGRKAAGPDAGKKKRKTCKPACEAGFDCVKVGKKRECVCATGVTCGEACCALGQSCVEGQCRAAACDPPCENGYVCQGTACVCPSGIECGDACCASGQTCENGACAGQPDPDPDRCIAAGEPCKATGRACCDGRVCSSGQGGERDVACYVPKTGACATTADCVFGTQCSGGACTPLPGPAPTPIGQLGAACNAATDVCTSPGAVCQAYTGDVPVGLSGTYCTLPLQAVCTGDADCSCYRCGYPEGSFSGQARREARADRPKTCCGPAGHVCASDRDCCEDNVCSGGTCGAKACTVCASGCAYTTIAAAIAAGVADIRVGAGTYLEKNLPNPPGSFVRIRPCGDGAVTIDADNQGRIMVPITTGKTVVFEDVTLRNGSTASLASPFHGGGFHLQSGGALTLRRAVLTGCSTKTGYNEGGAIYVAAGATAALEESTVSDALTGGEGGGIASYGTLTLSDSIVTGCRMTKAHSGLNYTGSGVGIASLTDTASLTMTGGEVSYNTGDADFGGGFFLGYWSGSGGTAKLTDVHIHHNQTRIYGSGGGIWVERAQSVKLERCRLTHNQSNWGAGLYVYSGTVDVEGGEISDNIAVPGLGQYGEPARGGGVYVRNGTLTLTDVPITRNTAEKETGTYAKIGQGAGLHMGDGAGTTILAGATRIFRNRAVDATEGDGIYLEGGETVRCSGTPASCSNPTTNPSGTTNCAGGGIYDASCSSLCKSSPATCPA